MHVFGGRLVSSVVVFAAALIATTPAVADPVAVAPAADPSGGLAFAGPELLWSDAGRLWAAPTGGAAVTRLRFGKSSTLGEFKGSATRLAYTRTTETCEESGGEGEELCDTSRPELFAGPPRGPFAAIGTGAATVSSMDLSGDLLATVEAASIARGAVKVIVRDLAAGGPGSEVVSFPDAEPPGVAIAGRWVALTLGRKPTTVVVYDLVSRAEVYRVSFTPNVRVDIQDDGTIAYAEFSAPEATSKLGWASVAEPTPHALPHAATTRAVIAGGRIAFGRRAGDGHEVAVTDLAGVARAVSRRVSYLGDVDFDGERIAWRTDRCVYAGTLPTATPGFESGPCPQVVLGLGGTFFDRISRTRTVKRKVICFDAPPSGCAGTVKLLRGERVLARRAFRLAPGARTVVALRLRAAEVRRWPANAKVRATASALDPQGRRASAETPFHLRRPSRER